MAFPTCYGRDRDGFIPKHCLHTGSFEYCLGHQRFQSTGLKILEEAESQIHGLKSRRGLSSFLFLVAMPGALSSFLFLVVRPGAPSSVLAPSSDARSP